MDSPSVVGAVGASGQIVSAITKTVKTLSQLRGKIADASADITIKFLIGELGAVKASLIQIQDWRDYNWDETPTQDELLEGFAVCMDGCQEALNVLAEEVEGLAEDTMLTEATTSTRRARFPWSEKRMNEHRARLHSQVEMLRLLIQALQCRSSSEQTALLREPGNREMIERTRDEISALRASRSAPPIVATIPESTTGSTEFDMDDEIVNSAAYRRAMSRNRSKRYAIIVGRNQSSTSKDEQDDKDNASSHSHDTTRSLAQETERSTSTGQTMDRLSPTQSAPETWQKPRPYERSLVSEPVLPVRKVKDLEKHLGHLGHSASVSDSRSILSFKELKERSQKSKHSRWFSISSLSNRATLTPSIPDTQRSSSPAPRWAATPGLQLAAPAPRWAATPGLQLTAPAPRWVSTPGLQLAAPPTWPALQVSPSSSVSGRSRDASRRGRRREEQDIHTSIDLNSPDGSSAPPIVRAAQSGSGIEIEELLDQGADVEERHEKSGRSALAVAAHCGNDDVLAILLQHGAKIDIIDSSSMTPLHLAASRGHYRVVQLLLEEHTAVDAPGPDKKTALRLATDEGHLEVAELLLRNDAKVNARDNRHLTPLHAAAKLGDNSMVNLLLIHGADIEAKDGKFMAAIHYACEGGHDTVVESLLYRKANIEAQGKLSMSPLACACSAGWVQTVRFLVKRKASVKQKGEGDMTPLHWASYNGHTEVVDLLVQKKAVVDARTADGRTPLHLAVMTRNFAAVDLLIRRGADIEAHCILDGMRPLHYACNTGDSGLVQLLLESGAQVESEARLGKRPLHLASIKGSHEVVSLLIHKGACVDARDTDGNRPLCLACAQGHIEVVCQLLDAGAVMRSKSSTSPSHEDSPLCVAAKNGHLKVLLELISRGTSVGQQDESNWQPLRYAAFYGHDEVVEALLENGASTLGLDPSGGWGYDMSAPRIGFSPDANIDDDRKVRVLQLLQAAEERERSSRAEQATQLPNMSSVPPIQEEVVEKGDDREMLLARRAAILYSPSVSPRTDSSLESMDPANRPFSFAPSIIRQSKYSAPIPVVSDEKVPELPSHPLLEAHLKQKAAVPELSVPTPRQLSPPPKKSSPHSQKPSPSSPPSPPPSRLIDVDPDDKVIACEDCLAVGNLRPDLSCGGCRRVLYLYQYIKNGPNKPRDAPQPKQLTTIKTTSLPAESEAPLIDLDTPIDKAYKSLDWLEHREQNPPSPVYEMA